MCIRDSLDSRMEKSSSPIPEPQAVGKHLDSTRKSYDGALGKLRDGRGNLLSQVDELRDLGVKTKKILPIVENEIEG